MKRLDVFRRPDQSLYGKYYEGAVGLLGGERTDRWIDPWFDMTVRMRSG